MADVDLKAGLQSLRRSLQQIKALLAWEQLKQSEIIPDQAPGFTLLEDSVTTELRNEFSFFLSISLQLHSILDDNTVFIDKADRQFIEKQLEKTEQQAYGLNLHHRFCEYKRV